MLMRTISVFMIATLFIYPDLRSESPNAVVANHTIFVEVDVQTKTPAIAASSAMAAVNRLMGQDGQPTGPPQKVRYEDRSPFGLTGRGTGWLFRSLVSIERDEMMAEVVVNVLIDGSTGDFVAAFTDPNENWFLPMKDLQDPEEIAKLDGWVMSAEAPDTTESTAIEAIAQAWKQFGIDLRSAGQVIARPRAISAQFPAREVAGKLIPLRPTERVWVVQVCGTKLHPQRYGDGLIFDSGEVMQFRDGSLEYVRGFAVP
jgi:hypothetical protein